MAKDFLIGVGLSLVGQAAFKSAIGGSVRRIDQLGKGIQGLQASANRIRAVRALAPELDRTSTAARQARERATQLGRAFHTAERPTRQLRREFEAARAEAKRLTDRLTDQRRRLQTYRTDMKQAGDRVRDLAKRERDLADAIAERGRLQGRVDRRGQARQARGQARGELFEAAAVGYAVAAPLAAGVGAAVRFESVMADVRKVVDFPTPAAFRLMGKDLRWLSTQMPVTVEDLGAITAAAGQAGIARGELRRFTRDAAMVGVAFDLSGQESGSAMTGLRSIFGLNQDAALDLAGAYNFLSNKMDATAPALLNIANRTGSTGKLFGLTGQQVGALGATFVALKTPPEVASTAMNALMQRLQNAGKQSKPFQRALDDIGMSAEGLQEHIKTDAQGALLAFLEAVDKSEDKAGVLFDLFGQEYADDITKVAGNLDIYRQALNLATAEGADASSVVAEYEARSRTTANALQKLSNWNDALAASVGAALLPALNSTIEAIGPVVLGLAAAAEQYPGVTAGVVGLTAGVVGLNVAWKLLRYAGTFVREGIENLGIAKGWLKRQTWALTAATRVYSGTAWAAGAAARATGLAAAGAAVKQRLATVATWAWTAATKVGAAGMWLLNAALAANPVGLVIAGVVALGAAVVALWHYWEPITNWLSEKWQALAGWVGDAVGAVGRFLGFGGEDESAMPAAGSSVRRVAPVAAAATLAAAIPAGVPATSAADLAPTVPAPVEFADPAPARQVTIHVGENPVIEIHAAPGSDPAAIAREVERQYAQMLRRAAAAADLREDDA